MTSSVASEVTDPTVENTDLSEEIPVSLASLLTDVGDESETVGNQQEEKREEEASLTSTLNLRQTLREKEEALLLELISDFVKLDDLSIPLPDVTYPWVEELERTPIRDMTSRQKLLLACTLGFVDCPPVLTGKIFESPQISSGTLMDMSSELERAKVLKSLTGGSFI